jgi:hypothetical protein
MERLPLLAEAVGGEMAQFAARVHQHASAMPAATFATHPLWAEAGWSATTYMWHPTSEAPPLIGLVFNNVEAGLAIFREAKLQMNNVDKQRPNHDCGGAESTIPLHAREPPTQFHRCCRRQSPARQLHRIQGVQLATPRAWQEAVRLH